MSTYYWTGATNTTWSTAGNWSPSGPPTTGDKVIVDASATKSIDGYDASAVQLAQMDIYQSASNSLNIGTPASPLKVGATILNIHLPDPSGNASSGLAGIYIHVGSAASAITVFGGPTSSQNGHEPVIVAGTSSSNILYQKGGLCGVGTMTDGQASTFAIIDATGGVLNIGNNVTLTTVTCKGATINSTSSIPTLNQYAGTTTLTGLAKISTAINSYGGTFFANGRPASGATIATCNLRGGTIDLTDLRALTITALSLGTGNILTGTDGASQLTITGTTLYWGDGGSLNNQIT